MAGVSDIPMFIQLTVVDPLNDPRIWFRAVRDNAPPGILTTVQVQDKTGALVASPMVHRKFKNKNTYVIPLVRDLTEDESAAIVNALDLGNLDYDVESSVSSPVSGQKFEAEVDEKPYDALCIALAKREHDRWMKERTDAGWRYGIEMDFDAKTHPLIVPWEQLPVKFRQPDQDSPQAVLDLLTAQGYMLVKKSEIEMLTKLMTSMSGFSACF